jgi:hypothetical protein
MTFLVVARLAMDLLLIAANAILALVLLKETGWRSFAPALLAWAIVARLDGIESPQPHMVGIAVAAAVVVTVARGAGLRLWRLVAVAVCALSTAVLQVSARL